MKKKTIIISKSKGRYLERPFVKSKGGAMCWWLKNEDKDESDDNDELTIDEIELLDIIDEDE